MRTVTLVVAAAWLSLAVSQPAMSASRPDLVHVSWQTSSLAGGPPMVQFHLQFHNPGPDPAPPTDVQLHAQSAYGAFVPNTQLLHQEQIPEMAIDSFFDIFYEIELSALPPLPPTSSGPSKGGGFGTLDAQDGPCPPDDHWDGNVDVIWQNAGGMGQANYHTGTIQVCPGSGNSYIHVITGCTNDVTWAVNGLCPDWNATLVNEDFSPAPANLPPFWTGWICISADAGVPIGSTCCISLDLTCNEGSGPQTATVALCASACECAVQGESSTWGRLKGLYR